MMRRYREERKRRNQKVVMLTEDVALVYSVNIIKCRSIGYEAAFADHGYPSY